MRIQQRLLGDPAANLSGGWSPVAIAAVTLGAGLAVFALIRRPFRRPPTAASST